MSKNSFRIKERYEKTRENLYQYMRRLDEFFIDNIGENDDAAWTSEKVKHVLGDALILLTDMIEMIPEIPENKADELDCYNCKWDEYKIGGKCVPNRLDKCSCIDKEMYEEWEKDDVTDE